MSASKLVTVRALLANNEANYGAGGAVSAATHAVLLQDEVSAVIDYVHDGDRGRSPGTSGSKKRGRPSGRHVAFEPKFEARGAGGAYSASVKPPDVHAFLLASGHSGTVDLTAGSQKWTYKPLSSAAGSAFSSLYGELYDRGQKYTYTSAYCDFGFEFEAGGFLVFGFPLVGLVSLPVDAGPPAATYTLTDPPKVENIGLAIGPWSPVVRKGSFKAGRENSARADGNANGHRGFSLGERNGVLEITVEACALATFDPYAARDAATDFLVGFTVGGVQFNRTKFTAAQAQIIDVKEDKDGTTALWALTLHCHASTPVADDDYEIAFS